MVSQGSLVRRVDEVMSTNYSCYTFHTLSWAGAIRENGSCDSPDCFKFSSGYESIIISDADCGKVRHHYYSTAHIRTSLRCSVGVRS